MRNYPTDSPEAMARLLALALIVDGSVHRDELGLVEREDLLGRIGIDRDGFDAVYYQLHEDMLACARRLPDGRLVLEADTVRHLLDDVGRPALQMLMVRCIRDIGHSDGILTGGETELLGQAMKRWGVDLFEPGGVGIPLRSPSSRVELTA
jgi:hypothetical protein